MSDSEFEQWLKVNLSGRNAFWNDAGKQLEVYLINEESYSEWIDRHLTIQRTVKDDRLSGVVFEHLDEIDTAVQNLSPDMPEYKSFLIYRQVISAYRSFVRGQVDLASLVSLLYLVFDPQPSEVYDEIEQVGREVGLIPMDSGKQELLGHFTGIL
jgi:hypothetical protein